MLLKKKTFIVLIIVIASNLFAQELKIKVTELLSIGNYEDGPEEYMFAGPTCINTDRMNNIYVADMNMSKIRVFNNQGKFIKSIGRKGQGPGEIMEVTCMTVDYNDDLIVVDRMNHRFTRFINMGEEIKTYPIVESYRIDPWLIYALDSESYVIYYLKRTNHNLRQENDKLIHIYNKNFSQIKNSVVNAGDIFDFSQPFLKSLSGSHRLELSVINKNKIIISPGFYDGTLYIYEKKGGNWKLTTLTGKKPENGSYKLLNRNNYKDGKYPIGVMFKSGLNGKFMVQRLNICTGLFVLSDGKLINFVRTLQKSDNYILSVELFSQDGHFLGCSVLSKQSQELKKLFQYSDVLWKDKDDRFYIYAYVNDIPYISVVKLDIKIN